MRTIIAAAFSAALFATNIPTDADTLELKNGNAVQGKYVGGTPTAISMQTAQGTLAVPIADVVALKFSPPTPPAPVPPPAAPVATTPVQVPAGTVLTVKMTSQVASTDKAGAKFTAQLLADLMAGNAVIAKAGTKVHGQVDQSKQAGRLAGKSQLAISLTGVEIGGKILPIMTTNYAEAGKSEFRKTARNVAVGAVVGNAIDNDGGAGTGAAVGAGVSLIKKGDAVTVPPGALLEFRLSQPVAAMPL